MTIRHGAWLSSDGTAHWRVWAPEHESVEVVLLSGQQEKPVGVIPLVREGESFVGDKENADGSVLYKLRVDGAGPFPDPWSRSQPFGVHGPSEIYRTTFEWHDSKWTGIARDDLIIEEIHVGTATAEGTFDALIPVLEHFRQLGITAIELMPVASFPGRWNWGYDGVSLFAPAAVYGGPEGLRRLVDAAHQAGIAVLLDVVYNHFGPDGNYLACFSSRYFTARHKTPWGDGINYDGAGTRVVRELILSNVEMWIRYFHLDGLRLDATHAIVDDSQPHILQEIGERAHAAAPHRSVVVIAEDERNESKLLRPRAAGGLGLDAVWADDLHHQLRRRAAGDTDGYFEDFSGSLADIATTLNDGWLYQGAFAPHFKRARGTSPKGLHARQFVHCLQNHDQVGNRAQGDRLGAVVLPEMQRVLAAILLLSPGTPMLFMGQEWNASTPFLYFTDHHEELGRAVTRGRREEFRSFISFAGTDIPDPQAEWTFRCSKLDWTELVAPEHHQMMAWYRALIALRRSHHAPTRGIPGAFRASAPEHNTLRLEHRSDGKRLTAIVVWEGETLTEARGRLLLSSESPEFGGRQSMQLRDGRVQGRGPGVLILEG